MADQASTTDDPLVCYLSALFTSVVENRPPPVPNPADAALLPDIRRLDSEPLEDAGAELLDRAPELREVVRLVEGRSWDAARPTKAIEAELDGYVGDRLGRDASTPDRLLRLDSTRRTFLYYLLMLTGREPDDEDEDP